MIIFLLSIISQAYASYPSAPLPSCLFSNVTWDQSDIFDVVMNCKTPEECQEVCANTEDCVSFTWVTEDADVFSLGCGLFSDTGSEKPCSNCVSGAKECPCTVEGECDSNNGNMIEAFPEVSTVKECKSLCENNQNCSFYTYFDDSHLKNLCLLFDSCNSFYEECDACVTGPRECDICSYEDTINGSCGACGDDWAEFESNCYKLLNNTGVHYQDIAVCKAECGRAGGFLASVHSLEENEFIGSLIQSHFAWIGLERGSDLSFGWTDGTPLDFNGWREGQPDGADENCVQIGHSFSLPAQWDDWECQTIGLTDCICKK